VGRIAKPHGLYGEVSVEPRTDEPDRRFAVGAVLATRTPGGAAPHGPGRPTSLSVRSARWHQNRLLVGFEEITDRSAAEAARGLVLVCAVDDAERPDDPDEFYDHQLIGAQVLTTDGAVAGELTGILHGAAQDLLAVRTTDGHEALVPFVAALVPSVDVAAGRIVVDDRPGLLRPAPEE